MSNDESGNEIDFLIEWAVWAHLHNKMDYELILLKGHLLIEKIIMDILSRNGFKHFENLSFFKKNYNS